jgi:hypothetical protein
MEFWGYTNQVRLRGLTKNQGFCNRLHAGFVFVAAVSTARCKIWVNLFPQKGSHLLLQEGY